MKYGKDSFPFKQTNDDDKKGAWWTKNMKKNDDDNGIPEHRKGSEDEKDFSHGKTWVQTGTKNGEEVWEWVPNEKVTKDGKLKFDINAPVEKDDVKSESKQTKPTKSEENIEDIKGGSSQDVIITEKDGTKSISNQSGYGSAKY